MKFRPHRELLDEAMAEMIELPSTKKAISDYLTALYHCDIPFDFSNIEVKPYGYDHRIGWDTHIVVLPNGGGVCGWTDGMPEN